ncbi:unnamed protein product [Laminaria digitata]
MNPRENKNLVVRLYKEGFSGDPRGLNRFFAPNYRDHSFFGDLKGLKAAMTSFHEAYPNIVWKVEHCLADGDRVAVRTSLNIRNAVGTARTVTSTSIYRIANGKIAEHGGNGDPLF